MILTQEFKLFVITVYLHLSCLSVSGLPGGERSLSPSQTWSAQPALEADASLCAPQRSAFCHCTQISAHKDLREQVGKTCFSEHNCALSSDVNVRVSVLTLYGALVTTQAPLPEVQLLLRQPEGSSSAGSFTPQDSALSWRQRDGVSSPSRTPVSPSQRGSRTHSPRVPRTPAEEDSAPPWLLQLCVSLVTQPREDQSDSDGAGTGGGGGAALEPSPVRLEALQVRDDGRDRK